MEQTEGAWEYSGQRSLKTGAKALFIRILRVPSDLNNGDEGEKSMKRTAWTVQAQPVHQH